MPLKTSLSKRRKKSHQPSRVDSNDRLASNDLRDAASFTKQVYEQREQACSYQDYLALITVANFNEHEIRHIPVEMPNASQLISGFSLERKVFHQRSDREGTVEAMEEATAGRTKQVPERSDRQRCFPSDRLHTDRY